ncbi:MAG: AAA family ATPase [Chloroflexaceae bacterium]|nr:AAA family ATPase [Chloroflexaceae bacterium]
MELATRNDVPIDTQAEQATLGSCLLERDAIMAIRSWLLPSHFYHMRHEHIYNAIRSLAADGIPPDISTVTSELQRVGKIDECGGVLFLTELTANTPTALHVEYYARRVQTTAQLRSVIETGRWMMEQGINQHSVNDIRAALEQRQSELLKMSQLPRPISASELLTKQLPETVWIIPGLLSAGFGYLAAPPGTGKTWMLLQWAIAVACGGYVFGDIQVVRRPVLFLALEDTETTIQARLRMLGSDLPDDLLIITEDREPRIEPLDKGGLLQIEDLIREYRPGLVVIDTLTAISPVDAPRSAIRTRLNISPTSLFDIWQKNTR